MRRTPIRPTWSRRVARLRNRRTRAGRGRRPPGSRRRPPAPPPAPGSGRPPPGAPRASYSSRCGWPRDRGDASVRSPREAPFLRAASWRHPRRRATRPRPGGIQARPAAAPPPRPRSLQFSPRRPAHRPRPPVRPAPPLLCSGEGAEDEGSFGQSSPRYGGRIAVASVAVLSRRHGDRSGQFAAVARRPRWDAQALLAVTMCAGEPNSTVPFAVTNGRRTRSASWSSSSNWASSSTSASVHPLMSV